VPSRNETSPVRLGLSQPLRTGLRTAGMGIPYRRVGANERPLRVDRGPITLPRTAAIGAKVSSQACAYRLCRPNVVPMETAEPSD